jgi:hypothetical protein
MRARCQNLELIDLLNQIYHLSNEDLCFSHIFESYRENRKTGMQLINASNCTVRYRPMSPPIVLNFNEPRRPKNDSRRSD